MGMFFFFKQKTAYEMLRSLVGSEMCIRDRYRGSEYVVDFLPKTKIEVAVSDENADAVIDAISQVSNTGKIGDGKIFVSSLDQVVRIRTGELNEDAL